MRNRVVALCALLSLVVAVVFGGSAAASRPSLEMVFFQGHVGTLILTPAGKVFVVDANAEAASRMIPFLRNRGIKKIDALLVTHPHGDHFAGIPHLMRAFKIEKLIDSGYLADDLTGNTPDTRMRRQYRDNVVRPLKARGTKHVTNVEAGHKVALDSELEIKLLGPRKQGYKGAITEARLTNKHSIIVFIRHAKVGIMLPGDAPDETQATIAHDFPDETRDTDVILLPHHGKYYCDPTFARHIGMANPHARVGVASRDATGPTLAKWEHAGLRLFHTDVKHGNVKIESTGTEFTVSMGKTGGTHHFPGK
jgi:competence protein ComEC